jgi:hypothetical protein
VLDTSSSAASRNSSQNARLARRNSVGMIPNRSPMSPRQEIEQGSPVISPHTPRSDKRRFSESARSRRGCLNGQSYLFIY